MDSKFNPSPQVTRNCGEDKCGSVFKSCNPDVSVEVRDSGIDRKGAGLGLFLKEGCKRREKIGNFGGMLLCGMCVKKKKGKFDTMRVERDYGLTREEKGVYWHLVRTGVQSIDGYMWYINSSSKSNPDGYQEPNMQFYGLGFYEEGEPAVEVHSIIACSYGKEGIADYIDEPNK